MIWDTIDYLPHYQSLFLPEVPLKDIGWLNILRDAPHQTRLELVPGHCFVTSMELTTKDRAECRFETHNRFIDLQIITGGGEVIDWRSISVNASPDSYEAERDFAWHDKLEPMGSFSALAGSFFFFFPNDAHRPQIKFGEFNVVRKIVMKIATDLLCKPKV